VEENHHRMPVPKWWKPYRQSITATLMQPPHYDSHITQAAAAAKNFHASSRSLPNATCRNWVAKTHGNSHCCPKTGWISTPRREKKMTYFSRRILKGNRHHQNNLGAASP
jgi:hypothetical protein